MDDGGCLGGQNLLRLVDLRAAERRETGDLVERQAGEDLEEAADVGVLGVPEVLPEVVRAEEVTVQPDGAGGGLAHLLAARLREQRRRERVELRPAHAVAEVDAVDDVAPLVGAAHLQDRAVAPVELGEIVALHDHVVEFQEAQRLLAVEPQLHRIEAQHAIDREVPADVAQEFDVLQLKQPVGIVDHEGRIGAPVVQDVAEDALDAGDVGVDLLGRQQLALVVAEGWVAHHRGAAAHEADRLVARLLEPVEHGDGDEVADVDRRRRGVVADIAADRPFEGEGVEPFRVGDLVDESALVEDAQEIGLVAAHVGQARSGGAARPPPVARAAGITSSAWGAGRTVRPRGDGRDSRRIRRSARPCGR